MFGLFFDLLHLIAAGALSLLGLDYDRHDDCERAALDARVEFVVQREFDGAFEPAALIRLEGGAAAEPHPVACQDDPASERPRRLSVI